MNILDTMRGSVSGAINFVVDKNRKISLINKVKRVIREEEKRANEAYIALGKYYFHNLRDKNNNETEFYCIEVEHAERRQQRAEMKLDELTECHSEIYNFDDEAFEEFCRECEENGCDGCEGCRIIPEDWDAAAEAEMEDELEESGMDVELPPQVQQALDEQKKHGEEPSPSEWSTLLQDDEKAAADAQEEPKDEKEEKAKEEEQ